MTAIFDTLAPVWRAVDAALGAVLPPWLRLIVWGATSGVLSMMLYARWSNQQALAALRTELRAAHHKLATFEGPMRELMALTGRTMALSAKQMRLSIGPAFLCFLPLLFVLPYFSNTYGLRAPATGETVRACALGAQAPTDIGALRWRGVEAVVDPQRAMCWSLTWPGAPAALEDATGQVLLRLPEAATSGIVHKRIAWNHAFGNPAGYLPASAPMHAVRFDLAPRELLAFGPPWMRGWEFLMFVSALISALLYRALRRLS
jgi:hypothetical protein